jgi:hypothetical protein
VEARVARVIVRCLVRNLGGSFSFWGGGGQLTKTIIFSSMAITNEPLVQAT